MTKEQTDRSTHLAEAHVDWQLKLLRPLLISYFNHGYKHGYKHGAEEAPSCPGCDFYDEGIWNYGEYTGNELWRRDGENGWVSD